MKNREFLIPLLVFILLIFAYYYRWEEGPTHSDATIKTVHMKDNWTGQRWIVYYGTDGKDFYSGDRVPYFTKSQIDEAASKVKTAITEKRKKELEAIIEEQTLIKKQNTEGHTIYVRNYEIITQEFEAQYVFQPSSHHNDYFLQILKAQDKSKKLSDYIAIHGVDRLSPYIDARDKWKQANQKITDAQSELNNITNKVEDEINKTAISNLSAKATKNNKYATLIWITLTFVSVALTIFIYLRGRKTDLSLHREV